MTMPPSHANADICRHDYAYRIVAVCRTPQQDASCAVLLRHACRCVSRRRAAMPPRLRHVADKDFAAATTGKIKSRMRYARRRDAADAMHV